MADRRAKLKSRSLERGKSAPLIVVSNNEDGKASSKKELSVACLASGHEFKKRSYYKPTYCHHCSELLWGIMNQGCQCTVCNYVTHEKCIPLIMVNCTHLKAETIVEHVPHQWVGPEDKKKWCNVCRKKINGQLYYCSVCCIYSHIRCRDEAFNDCKRCAIYSKIPNTKQPHHWVEGNLPSAAKCEVCQKSCATDLCLFGFKCGWCGITVHSSCLDTFTLNPRTERCTFRDTRFMIVPPTAVSLLVKDVETGDDTSLSEDCIPDLFSPANQEERSLEGCSIEEDSTDIKGRPALIIDGCGGLVGYKKWRKRTLQPTYIPKQMSAKELLHISLRKFGISADPGEFSISEIIDITTNVERILGPSEIPNNLQQSYNGPLKLYIRKQGESSPEHKLKVFNIALSSTVPFVEITIDEKITFADVIVKCIQLFELEDKSFDKYCIYESSAELRERIVDLTEHPSKRIQELTKGSLRVYGSLRFYMCNIEQTLIEMYVWKIPSDSLKTNDDARLYIKNIVKDMQFEIGPVFSTQGGLIIKVGSLDDAQKLSSSYKYVKAIPNIHKECLQINQEPLLVFVNTKSGGKQGLTLIDGFRRHLNPYQVYDLLNGGPMPGLYSFRNIDKYRIIVAGGDGTVGWVLGALDDIKDYVSQPYPPCGLIPLGTGNDLARALNWGGGYTGEKVMQLLYAVEDSDVVEFDRWTIDMCDPLDGLVEDNQSESKHIIMNNYLGIGLDAEIALGFHQAREENPEKFSSRFHNKGVYLQLGLQKTFSRDTSADLSTQIQLEVDGKEIELSPSLKGLVILNIASWGAGSEPWGSHTDQFQKCCFNDGIVEIMAISGPVHLGQIKSGIKGGIRIAQGRSVAITLNNALPIQIDGEAWLQMPLKIVITKLPNQASMLVKSDKEHFQHGAMSQGKAKSLISKQTIVGTEGAQFSSRRPKVLNSPQSQPTNIGISTRTLYIKGKDEEGKDED